ncbi:hypothetical protein HPB47_021901, partial [Ixodes persulcatus]
NFLNKHPNGNGVALLEHLEICHKSLSLEKLKIKKCYEHGNRWSATEFWCLIDCERNWMIFALFLNRRQIPCAYVGGLYWIPDGQLRLGLALLFALLGGFTNTLYLVSMFAVVTSKF